MIRVGLYGLNGHQIHNNLVSHPLAKLVAVAAFPRGKLAPAQQDDASIRFHDSFEALIADPDVDFIALCSPRRADQADHAIRALRAGKHVLAEKPCALTETDLDAIVAAARDTGKLFHEMAGSGFGQPYFALREVVRSGVLGEIVQVISEKSYPYGDWRPQDEALDGGLILQNAIHSLRFVEHTAGIPVVSVRAVETTLGNPVAGGGLRMASVLMLTLKNGGVASVTANYLNQPGTGVWGNESLKILGARGFVESTAGGKFTRLVIGDKDHGPLDTTGPAINWLDTFFNEIAGRARFPVTLAEELSPTRWVLRAKLDAKSAAL